MDTSTPETPTPEAPTPARSLLSRLAFQPSRPHLLIGLLFLLLGLLVTVAVVRPGEEPAWQAARAEDLVQILDDLDARQDRLEAEAARLAGVQAELEAGSTADAVAEARRRLAALQVLTGTTPVTGPGVFITLTDPENAIDGPVLIDAVQELRDAGAEAIQVGPARVVVDTWFADAPDGGVVVDGEPLESPIRIAAIGDPDTMLAALSIPGGLADSVRTRGAEFAASAVPDLTISVTVPASGP
jgi:uncharacterized protein YlxW (UPF0749 family)